MSDPTQQTPANDPGAGGEAGLPMFYTNPEPLDPSRFKGWGLKREKFTARFAAEVHAVPLALTEFHLAAKHFPIVFAPGPTPMPLAALSLTRNENLFVTETGQWADDVYIPAYVRRFPFVLAEMEKEQRMLLCIEKSAEMVTADTPDLPFFDAENQPTEITKQALELCRQFHEDLLVTRSFMAELNGKGLLKETELKYTAPDGQQVVAGRFITFDTEGVDKMADEDFLDLRRRNMLPAIFLQATSQTNWGRLAHRKQQKLTASGAA